MYASYKQGRQPEAGGLSWSKFCTTPELLECKVTARSDSILFNLIKNFNEADQTNPMTIWLPSLHSVEPRGVAQHLFEDGRVLDRCGRELGVLCPLAGGYFLSNMSMFIEERALDGVWLGVVLNGLVIRHWLFPRYTSFLWAVSFIGLDMIKVYGVPASYTCATLAIWFLEADWGSVGLAPQQKWPRILASGDAVDKGAGDIRVVKMLLALKRRYWSRATWVWRWLRRKKVWVYVFVSMFIGFEVTLLQIIYLLESQTCGKDG